jgi:hypothetical protein
MSSPLVDYNNPSPTLQGWISNHEVDTSANVVGHVFFNISRTSVFRNLQHASSSHLFHQQNTLQKLIKQTKTKKQKIQIKKVRMK